MSSHTTRRRLEHVTLVMQKSGHALAAYLLQSAATESAGELWLLVPDEDTPQIADTMSGLLGSSVAFEPGPEPSTVALLGEGGVTSATIRIYPASQIADFAARARSLPGRILFDHPGAFTRRRD